MMTLALFTALIGVLSSGPVTINSDSLRRAPDSVASEASKVFDSAAATVAPDPVCTLSIESLTVSDMMLYDTLDIILEIEHLEPAGCDLRIAVESGLVDIVEVLPGEIVDSCQWGLFRSRQVSSNDSGSYEVWQIVALAQQVSEKKNPICYGLNRPGSVARLVVSSAHRATVPDTTVGIFFYWESCRDNIISDREGSAIVVSRSVEDIIPIRLASQQTSFPTRKGTPDECISERAVAAPRRTIAFKNGGVVFEAALAPTTDSADAHP